ncbi:MAG: ABC transporter permease [Microbacteriaceae bacterium]|nr:ABC transporter permease [Microbacteriaceae bacterium]
MEWLWENREMVMGLLIQHVGLSVVPIIASLLVSVPLARIARRYRSLRGVLLGAFGLLFTIPSLALFVTLPAFLGTKILDPLNVVVALTIYGVAIMVRGTADAFDSVPNDVLDSASAVGYSPGSRFWRVELPLAGPVILANLRVVSVTTVSLLSVGALIGNGGLGYLFTNGYQRAFPTEIIIGVVLTLLIALIFDQILLAIGRIMMPWDRNTRSPESSIQSDRFAEAAQ